VSYAATPQMEPPGKRVSAALALAVHVLLIVFLFYGVHWQTRIQADAVEVELVRSIPAAAPARVEPQVQPRPEPKVERTVEPKPEPKLEPKPVPKPDIVIKEKPKPKEVPKPKEIPKPAVKEIPKPVPPVAKPVHDPFQQQLEQDLARTTQRKLAQDTLAKEMAELNNSKAAQAGAAHNKAIADYEHSIRARIKPNIVLPPDLKGNPVAVFVVTQLPDGEILEVRRLRSSGSDAYDGSIERAIHKSSPLPTPKDASLFRRSLNLTFCPDEDRGCK
jgi:colicin import membrane protein